MNKKVLKIVSFHLLSVFVPIFLSRQSKKNCPKESSSNQSVDNQEAWDIFDQQLCYQLGVDSDVAEKKTTVVLDQLFSF